VNGDHFIPSAFAIAPVAGLSAAIGVAIISAGNNVADVIAECREADAADRVNQSMSNMLVTYDEMVAIVRRQGETIDSMSENIELLAALCERQAAELARR
jgi:hypothetical protein